MTDDGVRGGIFLPTDGHLDPSSLTNSFFAAAKAAGVAVHTHTRVTGVRVAASPAGRRVTHVDTDRGSIECDIVIAACGMYTTEVAAMAGVNVPIVPMAHQYLITKPIDGVTAELPSMRDPDNLVYFRNQGGGLVAGGYERDPRPWSLHGVPADFNYRLLDEDWDRFAPLMEAAIGRVPAIESAQIIQLLNGPEGFHPRQRVHPGPERSRWLLRGSRVLRPRHRRSRRGRQGHWPSGCWRARPASTAGRWTSPGSATRTGAAASPGSGPSRCTRPTTTSTTPTRNAEPADPCAAARPTRRWSPWAVSSVRSRCGERPNWFPSNAEVDLGPGADPTAFEAQRPAGWAGHHWHPAIAAEAVACRTTAAIFDESSFAKIAVEGPSALALLQRLCDNDLDVAVGSIVYTQMLNERGGIECDFTVTRLAEDRFRIVTGTAFAQHDLGWIRRQAARLDEGRRATITDVTAAWCCFGLWGPAAAEILQPLTDARLDADHFAYLTAQHISLAAVPVLALRVTFVGESGWELYCPTEFGAALWDLIWRAGQGFGLMAGGYRAIDSLRLEKGYRVWGADITPDDTPDEAGLAFCVKLDAGDFIGRDALLARRRSTDPSRRLVCLLLDDARAVALGSEPVRRVGGEVLGRVTSGGQGHATGTSIAYAYIPSELTPLGTRVEVELFGRPVGATVSRPPWDPTGARIRA